ncbi:hypothetical protein FVR03_01245 [Pontibacter qinzhouensis]|uniref:Uncharacterized protein n=1 Tax=Pontibacter qinzhouensis TaxID=2603253 RepID=A0A5C8KB95_9BACT|nr:hypothetical protein [Pontibacter qinzhouensis]TXK52369.1 hypothetical protein FVR03_01245 [Pontibacter qinzhouensis]
MKAEDTELQIKCLNKASREELGLSFMAAMAEGYDTLETVHKAMEEYALIKQKAALERAAENAKVRIYAPDEETEQFIDCQIEIDKDSITSEKNLV